jgi:hypothetical protein
MSETSTSSSGFRLFRALLSLLFSLFIISTPLLAVWTASSMAAYHNKQIWPAITVGLFLFPLLPLLWELRASKRRQNKKLKPWQPEPQRILTFWDRIILRTLILNLLFLGIVFGIFSGTAFTALSTRGDWMLAESNIRSAEFMRNLIFVTADKLEWLFALTTDDPYKKFDASPAKKPKPNPNEKIHIVCA